MIPKPFDSIGEEDMNQLIESEVIESKILEFKQHFPDNSDDRKSAFLIQVSSFANTIGGDLIYGVEENRDSGAPREIIGIEVENPDKEKLRLEQLLRDCISPRLPRVDMKWIRCSNSKMVLIIRIQESWIGPHMILSTSAKDRFYARNSGGKYLMDVSQIRTAFNLSSTLTERIGRFKEQRVQKILEDKTPLIMQDGAKIILHIIPLSSFATGHSFDMKTIYEYNPEPMYCGGWSTRYNFDGVLSYAQNYSHVLDRDICSTYLQFFRNGIVEAVECNILQPSDRDRRAIEEDADKKIPYELFERVIVDSVKRYCTILKNMGVMLPIFISITLTGVEGYYIRLPRGYNSSESTEIERDILDISEVVLDEYNIDFQKLLKPCFDSIWNACGYSESLTERIRD